MLLIFCSIKAATSARNLEQWDEAERFAWGMACQELDGHGTSLDRKARYRASH